MFHYYYYLVCSFSLVETSRLFNVVHIFSFAFNNPIHKSRQNFFCPSWRCLRCMMAFAGAFHNKATKQNLDGDRFDMHALQKLLVSSHSWPNMNDQCTIWRKKKYMVSSTDNNFMIFLFDFEGLIRIGISVSFFFFFFLYSHCICPFQNGIPINLWLVDYTLVVGRSHLICMARWWESDILNHSYWFYIMIYYYIGMGVYFL